MRVRRVRVEGAEAVGFTQAWNRHCERQRSNPDLKRRLDCFVAVAPLRKRFAFVAGNDDLGNRFRATLCSGRYLPADLDHLIVGVALKKSSGVGGHPKP